MYALKAPETKRKYPQRLKFFFDFIFPTIKDFGLRASEFVKNANKNEQFVHFSFLNFITTQNRRVDSKEITAGTVRNYYKAAKLFCEMNDVIVNWKKVAKGLLREKQYGDDRAPTAAGSGMEIALFSTVGSGYIGMLIWILRKRLRTSIPYVITAIGSAVMIGMYLVAITIGVPVLGVETETDPFATIAKILQGSIIGISAFIIPFTPLSRIEVRQR